MKSISQFTKKCALLFTLIGASTSGIHATQFSVSNSPAAPGQFQQINDAIAAASVGDTIIVQGSTVAYNDFNLDKQLTIYGAGHHPQTQNGFPTVVNNIILFEPGSGSTLEGLRLNAFSASNYTSAWTISDLIVRNCSLGPVWFFNNADNVLFEGNIFTSTISFNNNSNSFAVFKNNLFLSDFTGSTTMIGGIVSPILFDHNTFLSTCGTCAPFGGTSNAIISNNIFVNYDTAIQGATATNMVNCIVNNNALYLCTTAWPDGTNTGSGNLINVDPMFINYPTIPVAWNTGMDLHLNTNSTLMTSDSSGGQVGMYGLNFEFHPTGAPSGIPVIDSFTISNSILPQGGTINATFNAVSPN